ncbi:hypothetical protein [Clostridium amazonitimonense]|uniref:hypothetical protein n=1 Tax=Clostridium amazonitimonense TaxID=1499689 RepID=UPI000A7423C2|nr:hypothetical protein [Clostridium amazonitimonense]
MKEEDVEAIKHYWDVAFDEKLYIDENNPKTARQGKISYLLCQKILLRLKYLMLG